MTDVAGAAAAEDEDMEWTIPDIPLHGGTNTILIRVTDIDGNTITDAGGGGVLLTSARFSYMDDSKLFTPGAAAGKVAPLRNQITRNQIHHCGRIRYYNSGVHLDSRPAETALAAGNRIANNFIHDMSRNGIFAFRNQGGNIIEFNHLHDIGKGTILFTGATASLRGAAGFHCLAVAKAGLRALAQSMARELQPSGIHVAHVVIDGRTRPQPGVEHGAPDQGDALLDADAIAETYYQLQRQPRSAWTLELDLRPWVEKF